ncbi:MAG: Ig-like domain-containing protein [Gemmatimonadota bacterium]|nr:Ig-like domain-containing protein [Gemmatimonadota bacterium]
MKVLRSTLVIGLAAFAAACGDKVTVAGPPTPDTTPKVNSVTVTPSAVTMSVGSTASFTAAVDVSNGAATTVTWSSSDASKVSVTAAGVATAVAATPGVAVCATSTADANKKGCASVVVSAVTNIPATVSIQSITATGTNNVTVNPAAVAGGIDVRLNVNPGSQTVTKVVLLVGSVRADSQTFTAAASAALRYAADQAIETQTTFPQILFSVNTAAFNATTGAPRWLNGQQGISAQVYTVAGGSSTAATATAQTNLTFANVDGFAITTSGGNTAVDATGYRWTGNGSLTVNALPVMYSGSSIGTVNAALGANTGCAAVGAIGSATTKTGNVYAITGALAAAQSPAGCTTTSPNLIVITATNAAGDNLTLAGAAGFGGGVLGAQTGLRWDNVPPATPGLLANPNGRSNGWVNGAVVFNAFNAGTAATANNWQAVNVADAGVGLGTAGAGITFTVKVGQGTSTTAATLASATGGTAVANATTLAQTSLLAAGAAVQDCAVAYAADALGNTTLSPGGTCAAPAYGGAGQPAAPAAGSTALQFGVDLAAPTAAFSTAATVGGSTNMGSNAALTAFGKIGVIATDTGLVGNSGFIGGTSVAGITGTMSRRTAASTSTTAVTVTSAAASATNINIARVDGSPFLVPDTLVYDYTALTTNAYYTLTTVMVDQAGNPGPTLTRVILKDNTIPTALAPVQNIVNPTAGGAVTFNANIADDLDLASGSLTGTFPAASFPVVLNVAGAVVANPSTATALNLVGPITFNTYNTAPAVTSGTLAATIPALFALQSHQTDSVTIGATANSYPTALNAVVSDMANAAVTSAAGTIQNAPAAPAAYAIGTDYTKFLLSRSGTTLNVAGSTTSGAVFSRTITPRVEGTTTMSAPFSSVDIYVGVNGAATPYAFVGTATLTGQTDNGGQRIWTFSGVSYTITSGIAAGADRVVFIGLGKGAGGKWIAGQGITVTVNP